MKKYRIEYVGFDSLKEDLGEDFVTFNCNVYPEDKEEPFMVTIPFYMVERKLQEIDPELYSILEKIKRGIKKWGMHDSVTIHEMEECGIDVGALAIRVIEKIYDLEEEEKRQAYVKSTEGMNEVNVAFEGLAQSASQMKTENENYDLLCTRIEKVLTSEMLTLFPIIFNSSSENIIEFENILAKHIPDIAEDLCELITKADQ
jgi:superfamily I DNA and RNA helicase